MRQLIEIPAKTKGETMRKSIRQSGIITLAIVLVLGGAIAEDCNWFCYTCRQIRNTRYCPDCGAKNPFLSDLKTAESHVDDETPFDLGIPDLHGQIIRKDQMNMAVFWVQTQLKATSIYYQGEIWDVTGNLGDHTMQEVSSFMQSRGYYNHNGQIDQTVINELAAFLGCRIEPVYVSGFYSHMDSIMIGGHTGSMQPIVSNLRDMIPHVTIGARWVQCCLKKLRYYNGPIDGKYGEATEAAVMAFQKTYGFEQRDYVTLGVARAMLEQCFYAGCVLYDLP